MIKKYFLMYHLQQKSNKITNNKNLKITKHNKQKINTKIKSL